MQKESFYKDEIDKGIKHIKTLRWYFKHREKKTKDNYNDSRSKHCDLGKGFHQVNSDFTRAQDLTYPVISIIGPRGSGKTTLLHELINKFKRSNCNDLVLPIINPNKFAVHDHPLLWIMAVLKEFTRDFDKRLRQQGDDRDDNQLWKCYINLYRQVLLYILNTKKGISSLYGTTGNIEIDTEHLIVEGYDIFASGYNLGNELKKFITKITDAYQKQIEIERGAKSLPLMVVAIDDIDINVDHFPDILDFISTCLSDLNRLVLIVCADYDTIVNVTTEKILSQFNVSVKTSKADSIIRTSEKSSEQFMLKYFPSQMRILLKKMNYKQRAEFLPILKYGKKEYTTLKEILKSIRTTTSDGNNDTSLFPFKTLWEYFCYDDGLGNKFEFPYFDILSGNPRTLETLYHHIHNWHKEASDSNSTKESLFELFNGMWDIAIKDIPSIHNGILIDDIVIWDKNKSSIFLNYPDRFKFVWAPRYPYITINGPWKNPFYYMESSFYACDDDKSNLNIHRRLSMWLLFLKEFCSPVGIQVNSGSSPGFRFELLEIYEQYPLFSVGEGFPIPILSTPIDWFLCSNYFKKFKNIIAGYLKNNEDEINNVYQIKKDHEEVIFRQLCHHLFCFSSIILKRSIDKDEIEHIWSVKGKTEETESVKAFDRKKLVDELVRNLSPSYEKSICKFIIQPIFENWDQNFKKYFNETFEKSIRKDYYNDDLKNDAKYAVEKFMDIPNLSSSLPDKRI